MPRPYYEYVAVAQRWDKCVDYGSAITAWTPQMRINWRHKDYFVAQIQKHVDISTADATQHWCRLSKDLQDDPVKAVDHFVRRIYEERKNPMGRTPTQDPRNGTLSYPGTFEKSAGENE